MIIPRNVYGIEGIDRLGKSTLIQGILDTLGYYQVVHFSKPQKLKIYEEAGGIAFTEHDTVPEQHRAAFLYQSEGFRNSMILAKSGARVIFDRWHIGEVVYSPLYRGYDGGYVYQQELVSGLDHAPSVRLILLVEDTYVVKHFKDDGQSLGPAKNRGEEQKRFFDAFHRSNIHDKVIVCVTDSHTGQFRPKEHILEEALRG